MRRHRLHEQTRRIALPFLDRNQPGAPRSLMSTEEAWLRLKTADQLIRKGITESSNGEAR